MSTIGLHSYKTLAILSFFCHAKEVKKLFIFFFTLLSLISFFSLQHVSSSEAFGKVNESCDCGGPGMQDCTALTILKCDDGLLCKKQTDIGVGKGICVKPEDKSIECTCEGGGGQSGAGKNKIKCKDKTFHCKDSNHACYPSKGAVVTHDMLQESGGYPGETLRGVYCREKAEKATCTCDKDGKAGDKKNTFKCKLDKNKSKTGTGGCGNEDAACKNDKNSVPADTDRYFTSLTGILGGNKGALITGIKCEIPGETEDNWLAANRTKPLPPPPSPPCSKWGNNGQCTSVKTALGDISTSPAGFIQKIFAVLLSISGGIALLLIIKSGYQIMTSQGKPEALQQAREQLIAAIVGLIFLIFSLVILQAIGVDILKIPDGKSASKVTPGKISDKIAETQEKVAQEKNPNKKPNQ